MRAKEFITERSVKPIKRSVKGSVSNLRKNPALDNNNHPYLAYRFGVALAASPELDDMYNEGPLGSSFITADYTDGDTEIRKAAEKKMGVKSQAVSGKGSEELKDIVNTTSPVAKPKRNKYGV